jgi:acetaldehyde dehydrogenase (acetylating)
MAGINVPPKARILVARLKEVGPKIPLSREKLAPVLAFYVEDGWHAGCERCIETLQFGGRGHTMGLHCSDEDIILQFGLQKPAFRIIVNSSTTAGAIGFSTGLMPSLTLATGGMGGGISSDNISVHHLMNVKRIAYEIAPFDPPVVYEGGAQAQAMIPEAKRDDQGLEAMVRKIVGEALARKA